MASAVVVMVLMAAFAVDLGMQRVARRDMQALADVVALDLARLVDGRTVTQIKSGADGKAPLETAKAASFDRNNDTFVGHAPDGCSDGACVRAYLVTADESGNYPKTAASVPVETAAGDTPNAVVVVASTEVAFAFSGIAGVDEGPTSRRALAKSRSAACFQLGSYAATVTPGASAFFDGLLGPLIGNSTLGLAGYNGLATADVALLDVIRAPSIAVGSVDELLTVPSLTAGDFYLAVAHALRGQGQIAQAEVLEAAAVSAVAPIEVAVDDLIGLSTADSGALQTRFNALDLLVGTAFLANGENFFDLPNLQAGVPSVGVTNTQFQIIERPRRACDDDEAQTAQVRLTSTAKLSLKIPLLKTSLVDLRLTDESGKPDGEASLFLDVELAGARGRLTEVTCDPDTFNADIWTDLIKARLSGSVRLEGSVKVQLGIKVVDVPVSFKLAIESDASKPTSADPDSVGPIQYPPQEYGEPVPAGGEKIELPPVGVSRVAGSLQTGPVEVLDSAVPTSVLDSAVNPVLDTIMPLLQAELELVNPLIDKVNAILTPLTAGMGISVAGADFFGLPSPLCNAPVLRG